jgi:hypothetical protein
MMARYAGDGEYGVDARKWGAEIGEKGWVLLLSVCWDELSDANTGATQMRINW